MSEHDMAALAPEELPVVVRDLQKAQLVQGRPPLVRHVMQHEHRPRKLHLAVVAVVGLRQP